MKIIKLVVDKKPKDCIACPLIKLRICGRPFTERVSSGSVYHGMKPDKRCYIKENK